jgi:hypothetical protein
MRNGQARVKGICTERWDVTVLYRLLCEEEQRHGTMHKCDGHGWLMIRGVE